MGMEMPSTTTTTKTSLPRRRSTEDNSHRRRTVLGDSESSVLDPEDFSDVFGGPPRSVMRRQFSGNEYRKTLFYEEIFTPPENVIPARCGRNLPEFRIPMEKCGRMYDQGFYSDIFGWEEEDEVRRSRTRSGSKSKASSSSVLSSEDVSPLRPAIGEADPDVSFFASKLRYKQQSISPPVSVTILFPNLQIYPHNFPLITIVCVHTFIGAIDKRLTDEEHNLFVVLLN